MNAIGIISKAGRYGGTYAHSDIAMTFATWISPEFQLHIMKDYRQLRTDVIKENLIPPKFTVAQMAYAYANQADMLNVVRFEKTAKQRKGENHLLYNRTLHISGTFKELEKSDIESTKSELKNYSNGKRQATEGADRAHPKGAIYPI